MEHVTTPETAQRLKDAGFPQPEPKPGQIWHCGCDFEWPTIVATSDMLVDGVEDGVIDTRYALYAPTATDILRELGWDYQFWFDQKQCIFACGKLNDSFNIEYPFLHTNPAEAAALAWLDKHEKENG